MPPPLTKRQQAQFDLIEPTLTGFERPAQELLGTQGRSPSGNAPTVDAARLRFGGEGLFAGQTEGLGDIQAFLRSGLSSQGERELQQVSRGARAAGLQGGAVSFAEANTRTRLLARDRLSALPRAQELISGRLGQLENLASGFLSQAGFLGLISGQSGGANTLGVAGAFGTALQGDTRNATNQGAPLLRILEALGLGRAGRAGLAGAGGAQLAGDEPLNETEAQIAAQVQQFFNPAPSDTQNAEVLQQFNRFGSRILGSAKGAFIGQNIRAAPIAANRAGAAESLAATIQGRLGGLREQAAQLGSLSPAFAALGAGGRFQDIANARTEQFNPLIQALGLR